MATAKVTVNGTVIVDLTDATAISGADVIAPKTAYSPTGTKITGTASSGSGLTLLGSAEYELSNITSTAVTIGTLTTTVAHQDGKTLLIKIRDKAGPRSGYYYGSDILYLYASLPDTPQMIYALIHGASYDGTSLTNYFWQASNSSVYNGVFVSDVYVIASTGNVRMTVKARYGSAYGLPVSGTYVLEVYDVDYGPV